MDSPFLRIGAALALLLLPLPALGATDAATFEARLLLPDGSPAASYTVAVVGHTQSAHTGPDGRFVLTPAPAPPFSLVASGPNGEVSAPIEVEALPAGPIDLTVPAALRDSITVVSGIAPSLDLLPGNAATVLTQEALEQRAPQRLYQVLESVAGASKLGDGADSVPVLRGLGRGRTLILLDGARVTAERRAGPSATFIEPASLASVEVLRGPGSVVYGSDALGGVLNAISRDPEPGRFVLRASVEGAAGALDQRSGYLAASADVGRGAVLLEGHVRQADDAEAGGGEEIFNSSFDGWGGGVRYVRDAGQGRLRLGFARNTTEDLGKAAIDSRLIRAFYPEETSERLTASWIGVPGGGWDALEASLFAGSYHIILDRDREPTATSNRRIDRADTDADDAALRTVAGRGLGGGFLQLGIDVHSRFNLEAITGRIDFAADRTTVTREQRIPSIEDARQLTSGIFATWSRPLGTWLSLGSGLRGDHVDTENTGGFFGDRAESDSAVTGHLALTAGPFGALDDHAAGGARLPFADAFRPLLPRPLGPRLRHRQPVARARDEPPGGPLDALRPRPPRPRPLRLPLPHRRPHRALPGRRQLLLPQPRRGDDRGVGGRGADRSRRPLERRPRLRLGPRRGRRRRLRSTTSPRPTAG